MAEDEKEMGAAYVPWGTFKKALEDLGGEGLPNQIDRSVWKSQSWGTQSQLVTAFKFLGLTDDKGKPSPVLVDLTKTKDEQDRKGKLSAIFRTRYADLFALDLTKATPDQLDKAMGNYRVTGETREKAVRFFLSALLYLGIPVSALLQPKAANGGAPRRGRKPGKKGKAETTPAAKLTPAAASGTSKSITLRRGETLTLSATADFFAMDPIDRKFVFEDLIERMEKYEQENPTVNAGQDQAKEGGDGE